MIQLPIPVWERTRVIEVDGEEIQLWTSRPATREDTKRRTEFLAKWELKRKSE